MIRSLLLSLALLAVAPASANALVIGVADQKPDLFLDERFHALGVKDVRLNVAFDAIDSGWQVEELDRWMALARRQGVRPLVSFGHSRTDRRALPSTRRFVQGFRRFRARYPFVRDFATWNEANHCGEPVCKKPAQVARYWKAISAACRRCRIAAASLLDLPSMVSWAKRFRRAAKREPRYWALHNYVEANRFKTHRLRRLLRVTKGDLWLAEVGGLVRRTRPDRTARSIPESVWHAERVTRWIFDELVTVHRRIRRVYLYHWNSSSPFDTWDSALIGPDGGQRPAYWVLLRAIQERRTP